jgi:hypothetical protein
MSELRVSSLVPFVPSGKDYESSRCFFQELGFEELLHERYGDLEADRRGALALQHTGVMTRGSGELTITVVPDFSTGEFAGRSGRMTIHIDGGEHSYDFAGRSVCRVSRDRLGRRRDPRAFRGFSGRAGPRSHHLPQVGQRVLASFARRQPPDRGGDPGMRVEEIIMVPGAS